MQHLQIIYGNHQRKIEEKERKIWEEKEREEEEKKRLASINPYENPFDNIKVPFEPDDISSHAFKRPWVITLPPLGWLRSRHTLNLESATYDEVKYYFENKDKPNLQSEN